MEAAITTQAEVVTMTEGGLSLRLFGIRPADAAMPLVLYFHGGLFNSGAVEDADGIARELSAGMVVACVDYPLAPALHFPDTVEAAYAAAQWAWSHAARYGADPARLFVAGDQAGGNLAAAVAMMARDRAQSSPLTPAVAGQILITPLLDPSQTTASMLASPDCPCRQAWKDYLPTASDAMHPYAAPLHSRRLAGLAPALLISAERDPLRDEVELYAARLIAAGVPVQVKRFEKVSGGLADPRHACFSAVAETAAQFVSDQS